MVDELLGPGAENREDADGAANEAAVVGKLDDGFGQSLHQQGVAVTLVGAQQRSQLLRHRDGDGKRVPSYLSARKSEFVGVVACSNRNGDATILKTPGWVPE